jgi:hypothetical protein
MTTRKMIPGMIMVVTAMTIRVMTTVGAAGTMAATIVEAGEAAAMIVETMVVTAVVAATIDSHPVRCFLR